jgi:iron(III) transport system permease protein
MTGAMNLRSVWFWLSVAALVVMATFVVYPILNIVTSSLGGDGWARLMTDPRYGQAIRNSLMLAVIVTVLCTLIGVPLAYFTARFSYPGKALIAILPLITLVIPEVIVAQTWLMMLGNNGLITRFLRGYGIFLPSFYGWFGLITAMTFIYYTYVYISTVAAISGFDAHLEEAAQSLGSSPNRARLTVMVPVVLPAILSGALLVFTMVIGNFAISITLAHRVPLLSVQTYQAAISEGGLNPVMQSTLASVTILIVMLVLFANRWIVQRGRYEVVQGRGAAPVGLRNLRGLLIGAVAGIVVLISLLPLIAVIVGAFTRSRGPVMQWGNWTFENIERVFVTAPQPLLNSLTYAGAATLIGIVFSTIVSYMIVKKPNLLTPVLDYISVVPLALSGTVLGIGLIISFHTGWISLTGTASIIVLALVVRRLPFGMRNASSTLHNIPNSIEEASVSLGVAPFPTFLRVVLPLMIPAVAAAAVLTWTTSVAELSASILVYSGGRETLTIQVFRLLDSGLMAYASAYGLALVLLILLPVIIAARVFRIDVFGGGGRPRRD